METTYLKDSNLKTHYYNNTYIEAKEAIIKLLKETYARIDGVSDEYKEIACYDLDTYYVTFIINEEENLSIDLVVNAPFLYSKKKYIKNMYQRLDKVLNKVGD